MFLKQVSPFGHLRIKAYVQLPEAFRSLSRPSSAPSAKAFSLCSFLLDQLVNTFHNVSMRKVLTVFLTLVRKNSLLCFHKFVLLSISVLSYTRNVVAILHVSFISIYYLDAFLLRKNCRNFTFVKQRLFYFRKIAYLTLFSLYSVFKVQIFSFFALILDAFAPDFVF